MDISLAKKTIGYNHTTSLKQGLKETWEWFINNRDEYLKKKNYFKEMWWLSLPNIPQPREFHKGVNKFAVNLEFRLQKNEHNWNLLPVRRGVWYDENTYLRQS